MLEMDLHVRAYALYLFTPAKQFHSVKHRRLQRTRFDDGFVKLRSPIRRRNFTIRKFISYRILTSKILCESSFRKCGITENRFLSYRNLTVQAGPDDCDRKS